jgi:hypothetical protein
MKPGVYQKPVWLKIIRWMARIIALLVVAFFLMMFIGESLGNASQTSHSLNSREIFIFTLFGMTMVGLVIGLWLELIGGLISLISTLTHIIFLTTEGTGGLTFFYLMIIPSFLYLLSWYFNKTLALREENSRVNAL